MKDKELQQLGIEYLKLLEESKDKHYEINEVQYKKLERVILYFKKYIKENGGSADPIDLTPNIGGNGLTCYFTLFDICGDEVQEFCDVIKGVSAFSLDATNDGQVCISVTVPNIFISKK